MNKTYKISSVLFDGKDVDEYTLGIYSEEDTNQFVKKLLEYNYELDHDEEEVKSYYISLPEPSWDHHGNYSMTYIIKEVKTKCINDALNNIIDPSKWDQDEEEESCVDYDIPFDLD